MGRFHKKGVSEEGCMFKDAATKGYRRRSTPALLFYFLTKTVDAWTSQVEAEDNSNSIMRMAACDAVHRNTVYNVQKYNFVDGHIEMLRCEQLIHCHLARNPNNSKYLTLSSVDCFAILKKSNM